MQVKRIQAIVAAALFSTVLLAGQKAEACSGFIIGKDLTEDGNYMYGRTEDYPFQAEPAAHNKNFIVHEAADYENGEVIHDGDTGFTYPHAEHEMKYTAVPDGDRDEGENANGTYGAHGFNEAGVSMSATVTATPNKWQTGNWKKISKEDPFLKYQPFFETYNQAYETAYQSEIASGKSDQEAEAAADQAAYAKAQDITEEKQGGLGESSMIDLVLPRAKTAREGIEIVAKAIDEKGAYDGNIVMIADKKELWYMEILSGHEYVAIKYPADKFSIMSNTYFLGSVDFNDKENVIASKNVESLAKRVGAATYDKDGNFLIARSYSTNDYAADNRSRTFAGIKLLDPDSKVTYDDPYYDFLHTPSNPQKKYTVRDAIALQRNRFEHLPEYKPDDQMPNSEKKVWVNNDVEFSHPVYKYALGNQNVIDPHIYQVDPELPDGFGGVAWIGLGQSRNTPYLAFYGNITQTPEVFHSQAPTYDSNSWYWTARNIDKLASEHSHLFGNSIQDRWKALESAEIARQKEQNAFYKTAGLSAQAASENVTKDFLALAEVMFKEMKLIEGKMMEAIAGNKEALNYIKDLSTLPSLPKLHLAKADPDPTVSQKPEFDLKKLEQKPEIRPQKQPEILTKHQPSKQAQTVGQMPNVKNVSYQASPAKSLMAQSTADAQTAEENALPKTGSKTSQGLVLAGFGLLSLLGTWKRKVRK